jgi:hypothetical protein
LTAQQIDYWKLQESKRANQASELENATFHRNSERLQSQVNAETERHNKAVEAINRANLSIAAKNAAINELNAQTNARLANLTAQRDAETARHNAALEGIQDRYNEASLALTGRKLTQEWDLGQLQRASTEGISAANRSSSESIAQANRQYGIAGTIIGSGTSLLSQALRSSKAVAAGSSVIAQASKKQVASGLATGGTIVSTLGVPIAVGTALGLGVGYWLDKTNAKPFTPTFDNEELKKGVKSYGAE